MLTLAAGLPREAQAQAFELQVLHASDLEAGTAAIEDAPRFSAVLEALRSTNANTLVLSSGDNYIPGPFFNAGNSDEVGAVIGAAGRGRADIAIMNAIGFQASALGNHEFDAGSGTLASAIGADGDYPGAQFPYLSSNLDIGDGDPLASLVVGDGMAPLPNSIAGSVVLAVGGEMVGVIGATTPLLGTISSPGADITVQPPDPNDLAALAAIIQAQADALTAAGINKIILVSHLQQFDNEFTLATLLSGVDIIVAGGSNTRLADSQDRLRDGDESQGDYPTMQTDVDGNPVALVNTDGNYSYVGRLVISFDDNGVIMPASVDPAVSGVFATDDQGVADVGGTPNSTVQAIVDAISAVIEPTLSNVFGKTNVFLNGTRGDVRTQETNLGNLTADANLALARTFNRDVVVSLKNGGGIRADIGSFDPATGAPIPPLGGLFREDGEISQLDIQNTLRFNNSLSVLTVTAAELLAIVEHGVSATAPGVTPGRFPQIGGMAFSFDPALPPNARVRSLVITERGIARDVVVQDGAVVGDANRTFGMVTLNFLAGGGDGYPFPTTDRVDLPDVLTQAGRATFADPGTEQDALAEYLAAVFTETPYNQADVPPEQDRRIQNLSVRDEALPPSPAEPADVPFRTRGLFSLVQFIHSVPDAGPVDIYIDDRRILDDFTFMTATPFVPVLCPNRCTRKIDIVPGAAGDNSNPVFTANAVLQADKYYAVIAVGVLAAGAFDVLLIDRLRPRARQRNRVEYLIVNGLPGQAVDIRSVDRRGRVTGLLANNLPFGEYRGYFSADPALNVFQITTANNSATLGVVGFDFTAFAGQTLTLIGTPLSDGTSTVIGFDSGGNLISPVSSAEARAGETNETLAVEGNYPNPFNPSTTIRFDLSEPAWVRLEIIDMLGRKVMTLPRQRFDAGTGHAFNVDASALASGTYLYRVIAQTSTRTLRHTGRMILSK